MNTIPKKYLPRGNKGIRKEKDVWLHSEDKKIFAKYYRKATIRARKLYTVGTQPYIKAKEMLKTMSVKEIGVKLNRSERWVNWVKLK